MKLSKAYVRQVFLNCPFDDGYRPIYEAIIFSVIHCGFVIRCAREREDSGEPRISKIVEIIRASQFGIHDISRVELDEVNHLPRFNMPLELGLFLGAKAYSSEPRQKARRCLKQCCGHCQPLTARILTAPSAGADRWRQAIWGPDG